MTKAFVLDTNVCIDDPESLNNFDGRLKILPITVIEELDRLKRGIDERAINSRKASRIIKDAIDSKRDDLVVLVESDLDQLEIALEMMALEADDLILLYYKAARDRFKDNNVILVTNDNNMFIKASAYGYNVENVKRHSVDMPDVVIPTLTIPEYEFDEIAKGKRYIQASDYAEGLYENQYVVMTAESNFKQSLLGAVQNGVLVGLDVDHQKAAGIEPKNKEQRFLMNALNDQNIDCVIVNGSAGAGKTLISLAVGVEQVARGKYEKIIVTKPTYAIDNEIGHLPGSLEEKMMPWVAPYQDNIELIYKKSKYKGFENVFDSPYVEIMALTFIRGRSIMKSFMIIDETQNIPPATIRTIVSRAGNGTKLVLLGDITQIDNPTLNKQHNGLSYALSKLKGNSNIACLQMTKSFRSRLAQIAVDVL